MAVLSAKARRGLPVSDFALPASRSYPIPDASHARNALARASQHASPAERAEIEAKVHQRFPAIGKSRPQAMHVHVHVHEAPAPEHFATGTTSVGTNTGGGVGGPNGPGQTITNGTWTPPRPSPTPNQDLRAKLFPSRKAYAGGAEDVRPSLAQRINDAFDGNDYGDATPRALPASVGGGSASAMALREEIARRRAARANAPAPASRPDLPTRSYSSGPPRDRPDAWLPSHGVPPQPPVSSDIPVVDMRPRRSLASSGPEFRPLKGDVTEPPLAERERARAPANAPDTYGKRQVDADRQTAAAKIARAREAIKSGQRFDKNFEAVKQAPRVTAGEGGPPRDVIGRMTDAAREKIGDVMRVGASVSAAKLRDAPRERGPERPRNPGFGQRAPSTYDPGASAPSAAARVASAASEKLSNAIGRIGSAVGRMTTPAAPKPEPPPERKPGFGQRDRPPRFAGGTNDVPAYRPFPRVPIPAAKSRDDYADASGTPLRKGNAMAGRAANPGTYGYRQMQADRMVASDKIDRAAADIRSGQRFAKGFNALRDKLRNGGASDTPSAPAKRGFLGDLVDDFRVRANSLASKAKRPGMTGYARGVDTVPGRGTGRVDKIPAMLAPHEAVLNAPAADLMGRGRIKAANDAGRAVMGMTPKAKPAGMSGLEHAMSRHADQCHPVRMR